MNSGGHHRPPGVAASVRRRGSPSLAAGALLVWALLEGTSTWGAGVHDLMAADAVSEAQEILGDGVVGDAHPAWPLTASIALARWEPGEWTYRVMAGPRRDQTERESLVLTGATARGEAWTRTVGREYTLHVHRTADGHLVMPSEIAHDYDALVRFEPPLIYLVAAMEPGGRNVFEGTMDVYSSSRPAIKLYHGTIRATTVYAGVRHVTTPAGVFRAAVIKTEYQIDILSIVSVRDSLYTFYAEGVGKVAEAERRQVVMGLFRTDTKFGKILLSFTSGRPSFDVQSP